MRHILIWVLPLLFPLWLHSQQCAPAFPLVIPSNDSASFNLEVFGIAHDDLAAVGQGLCAVRLNFIHHDIFDFEIWLTSPAGQTMQLIGPNATLNKSGNFGAKFDVAFIACQKEAQPDPGFQDIWDNQSNDYGFLTQGSYYPFGGCLEAFNTGSVNGVWTLKVKTFPTNTLFPGRLLNFELEFCDELGRHCCFADAGTLGSDTLITACAGDSALYLPSLAPQFTGTAPDTARYAYTWALGKDSILTGYTDTLNFRAFPAGNYQVCGLSYAKLEYANLPAPNSILRLDTLRANLNSLEPDFCGKLTPTCLNVQILPLPDTTFITASICPGDLFRVENRVFASPDRYFITAKSVLGCDSIIQLDLSFRKPVFGTLQQTICDQDSLVIAGNVYRLPGTYTDTLQSVDGCDSILTIQLTVIPTPTNTITRYICQGGSYILGGKTFKIPGTYSVRVPAATGCDSLIYLTILSLAPQAVLATPAVLTCDRPEVLLNGAASQPAGKIQYVWEGTGGVKLGTDSILRVNTPGRYVLKVIQSAQGLLCANQVAVFVTADLETPSLSITRPDTLTCTQTTVSLRGKNNGIAPDISFQWLGNTTPISTDTLPTLLVKRPGDYRLTARDRSSGCRDTVDVRVLSDTLAPSVWVGLDQTLTCARPIAYIGDSTASQTNFTYLWTVSDGQPILDATRPFRSVQHPATWMLQVTSLRNGCSATDSVTIRLDTLHPMAVAGIAQRLTCNQPIAHLNGSGSSSGPRLSYHWEAFDGGRIPSNGTQMIAQADAPGRYTLTVRDTLNGCVDIDSVFVTASLEKPEIPFIRDEVLNCRDTLVYLKANLPDNQSYTFRWCSQTSTGDSVCVEDLVLAVNQSGIFTFELTYSETGCTSTEQIQVNQDITPPLVEAGNQEIFRCNQTEIQLNGSTGLSPGRYRARWTGTGGRVLSGENTLTPVVSGPGRYILTIEDVQNACSAADTVQVVADTRFPNAYAGSDTTLTCFAPALRLLGSTNLSSWAYEATWTTPNGRIVSEASKLTPLVDKAGMYILQVRDRSNGCARKDTVQVFDNIRYPTARIDTPATSLLLTCRHDTLVLDGMPSSSATGTVLGFSWRNLTNGAFNLGASSNQIHVYLPGIYHLMVQDPSNGCRDTMEIQIEADFAQPIIQIAAPEVLTCALKEVGLEVAISSQEGKVQYNWQDPNGQIVGNTALLRVGEPGQYTVLVTNTKTGCTAKAFTMVRANRTPPSIVFAPVESLDCDTRVVALIASNTTGGSRLTFSWNTADGGFLNSSSGPIVQAVLPGWYTLNVFNPENGCQASDSIEVYARANAIDSVAFTIQAPGCSPLLAGKLEVDEVYGGAAPYRFFINNLPSDETGVFDGLAAGTFTFKAIDAAGCTWSIPVEIPQPARISVDLGPDLEINAGDSTRLEAVVFPNSPGLSFTWIGAEGLAATSGAIQTVRPQRSTTYEVRVTASNLCTASDQIRVQVVQRLPVFIPNAFSPNGDGQNDVFYIQSDPAFANIRRFQVFDRWGALVFSRENIQANDPAFGWDGISVDGNPRIGVYIYHVVVIQPNGREAPIKGDILLVR